MFMAETLGSPNFNPPSIPNTSYNPPYNPYHNVGPKPTPPVTLTLTPTLLLTLTLTLRRIFPIGRPYRVLFAEYFSPKNVYALLGRMRYQIGSQLEITVVTNPNPNPNTDPNSDSYPIESTAQQIRETIGKCLDLSEDFYAIHIIELSLSDYLSDLMSKKLKSQNQRIYNPDEYLFDFIEYNGGLSLNPFYREHLKLMKEVSSGLGLG
jgi:hypothetical protein